MGKYTPPTNPTEGFVRDVDHCTPSEYVKPVTIKIAEPAHNSDNLDRIEFKEVAYEALSQRGLYKPGDRVMWIPGDSILPTELSDLLGVTSYLSRGRVKTIRLRGNRSEGLTGPIEMVEPFLPKILKYEPKPSFRNSMMGQPGSKANLFNRFNSPPAVISKFYKMPNLLNAPYTFKEGDKIVVTEKIHGCLTNKARITMADGSIKVITKVLIGDNVLGYDTKLDKLVPSRVNETFNNGKSEKWLKISISRKGHGANKSVIRCTPNHKLWSPMTLEYIDASSLKVGGKLLSTGSNLDLTYIQEQVILGKLLGDGCLHRIKNSSALTFGHKKAHEEYVDWTNAVLSSVTNGKKNSRVSGYGSDMVSTHSLFLPGIKGKFDSFYSSEKKTIPKWVASSLSPISIAIWYMDDGSLCHTEKQNDRASFAVCNFTNDDCNILVDGLLGLGIESEFFKDSGGYSRLRINEKSADKMFALISPYIPPVMQYKLPERYRGGPGWIPRIVGEYKNNIYLSEILSIEVDETVESFKYDISTDTHNFFANGSLVHNSNFRCGNLRRPSMGFFFDSIFKLLYWITGSKKFDEYQTYVGSHNRMLNRVDPALFGKFNGTFDKHLKGKIPKGYVFYGELYGPGIQKGFNYGLDDLHIRLFAAKHESDSEYIDRDSLEQLCRIHELPIATGDCEIAFTNIDDLRRLAESKSNYTDKHIREGIVCVLANNGHRMAKLISFEYLKLNDRTEHH